MATMTGHLQYVLAMHLSHEESVSLASLRGLRGPSMEGMLEECCDGNERRLRPGWRVRNMYYESV